MSSFNPLAAAAIANSAALTQSAVAAIDLGVEIEILQTQLAVGDLLTATILPPQGGADLLSLLGQTVVAQLPPGIDPGQSLLLQVTGFQGNQILVRNLGVVDPNNPPPTVTVNLPQPAPDASTQATLTTVVTPPNVPADVKQAISSAVASGTLENITESGPSPNVILSEVEGQPLTNAPPPIAPPRAVFVAASVQHAQPPSEEIPNSISARVAQIPEELGLEARIIAARAVAADIAELVNTPGKPPAGRQPPSTQQTPPQPRQIAPPVRTRVNPPPISVRTSPASPSATTRGAPIAPELALLARLRIPVLASTLAAARLASTAASALPRVLSRLDALLAQLGSSDGRAATLRTLLQFAGKLDPSNARTLPEQLMAFVNNVVDGAESKLGSIFRALLQSQSNEIEGQLPAPAPAAQQLPPSAAANVAERAAALQYDLKATIASLIETPPSGSSPGLTAALNEALTTITAVQLNVLNAQNLDPTAITIPLPVFYHDGGRPAQIRVARDLRDGKRKIDAENFHIGFVLDTKTLGTVAIDVQTASRTVTVHVKTEGPDAAQRFSQTLDDLRGRLESLSCRVANIAAAVAPHLASSATEAAEKDSHVSSQPEPVERQTKSSAVDFKA